MAVNCRIGSLEKWYTWFSKTEKVNCRIGSLEIAPVLYIARYKC